MANALYELGREGFLAGEIDWDTAVIKAALIRTYTPDLNTHKFMSSLPAPVATSAALTGKTLTLGIADAADVTFTAVAAGAAIQHLVVFQASAVGGGADVANTAQRLICLIDTTTGVVLPVTPNGGDIIIQWDNGANKIFKL